jgi:hypothetical protein
MNRLAPIVVLICMADTSIASDLRLAWDASTDASRVIGYRLYAHTNQLSETNLAASVVKRDVGTNLTARLENLSVGRWWFAATAVGTNAESGPSNILLVDIPAPPANMRMFVVQYSGTLTNFYDVGFFRLRLP